MGSIAPTIAAILGTAQVTAPEDLAEPWRGTLRAAIATATLPACIAYPQTPDELAEVVTCAHQNQWRILPCGHGSKLTWGALVFGVDLVISTQHLDQVVEHAAGDLTVTAQAGVSFAALQSQLRQTRQFLAIDPAYPDQATLGGIVATRDAGALRQRFGGIRDMLIGVSFVRYDGQLAKAGGRVVKNVAGYDLMKLMTGSFGTLGILTQLTWRTYPQQAASQTVVLTGEADSIQQVTAAVLESSLTPVAMDVLSPGLATGVPSDVWALALQFQSIEAGVAEQVERLQAIAHPHPVVSQILTDQADADFWPALNRTLFPPQIPAIALCKIGILPARAVDLLTFLDKTLAPATWQARIHAASGIGTLRLNVERNTVSQVQQVRARCQAASGYLTLLEAPPEWKAQLDPWGIDPATRMMMTRLQEKFDPHSRLSPGRMG